MPKPSSPSQNSSNTSRILGNSSIMQQLNSMITKLARGQVAVYVHGESGSGKELVAQEIHRRSWRNQGAFVPVNCGAIPENLMESEFFGHKKGSFTGAIADKQGLFQAAHQGTLFLDEVADLPLNMQVKLLRAIQEGAVKPIGGVEEIPVDVRIISASHKALADEVLAGRFRQDLYYRLNVVQVDVPALRDRREDILLLVDFFLNRIAERWRTPLVTLNNAARQALLQYSFPGNVRELENILERACTLCEAQGIEVEDLRLQPLQFIPPETVVIAEETPLEISLLDNAWNPDSTTAERDLVLLALQYTRWNRTRAAEILGMSFRQLCYRIQKYALDEAESS